MYYEIVSIRTMPSEDGTHHHVELIGYISSHMPGEPILIPIARALQKIAFAERFHVKSGDETIEVTEGKCSVCGFGPTLQPEDKLLALPQN